MMQPPPPPEKRVARIKMRDEKRTGHRCILKLEVMSFLTNWMQNIREKEKSRMTPCFEP